MKPIVDHVKGNLVAYIALFVALGGTSYAAVSLPANSVGTAQLRNGAVSSHKIANGSVTASKLDPRTIGGSVREWAHVSDTGQILGGSRGAHASVAGNQYVITWGTRFSERCDALVTAAAIPGIGPIADATGVAISNSGQRPTAVYVWTYSHETSTPAPFYVAVIC